MYKNYNSKRLKAIQIIAKIPKVSRESMLISKEKRASVYIAFTFLILIGSLTIYFTGDSIFIDKISISLFIISCLLLIKMNGQSNQN